MKIFLAVCWVSICTATNPKRKREELTRVAFNSNIDQYFVPKRIIGMLTTVPDNFLQEAHQLLVLLGGNRMFPAKTYLLDIQKKYPESTVNLINVTAWLSEIREPVFSVPFWFHHLVTKHEQDTTDELLPLVVARPGLKTTDPDYWERRIEIWRHYCVGSCLSSRSLTEEKWQEYLTDYRMKLSFRYGDYSKSLSYKMDLPQEYLIEADLIVAMLMQNTPFNSEFYRSQLRAWVPTTTITAGDVRVIAELIQKFTAVRRWFHELLMANKALNSEDLTDLIVTLAHPGHTDAASVSRKINVWRRYCISSPVDCQDMGNTWNLTASGRSRYYSDCRNKIGQLLARHLNHEAEKTMLRKHISEQGGTPPAEQLLDFVIEKIPNSYIAATNVKHVMRRIECQLYAPKWFHELLLAHPEKSADHIVAMVADSNTSWTNRRPDSVKESVEIWRQYVINQTEEECFVPSELQSEIRGEPIYRLNPEATKRLLQN